MRCIVNNNKKKLNNDESIILKKYIFSFQEHKLLIPYIVVEYFFGILKCKN